MVNDGHYAKHAVQLRVMAIGIFYTEVIVVVKCAISNWPSDGHYFFEDLVEDWNPLDDHTTI